MKTEKASAKAFGGARVVVPTNPSREVGTVNAGGVLTHPVDHESHLERRFIMTALACPVVTDIVQQPETVTLTLPDGSTHKYTPDFRVTLQDKHCVTCEVKPAKFVGKYEGLFASAKSHFEGRGESFAIFTDKQIDDNGRSARAILLMRYGRVQFSQDQAAACKRLLEEEMAGSATVRALVDRGVAEGLIWSMVAAHALRTKQPLNIAADETVEITQIEGDCLDQFQRWFGYSAG